MSHGMRIWGADGALQIDENSFTVRSVLFQVVTFSGSTKQVKTFPVPTGCTSLNCVATVIPIGAWDSTQTQFETLMRDDGFVDVYNYVRGWGGTDVSYGSMQLMIVRFR